MCPIKLPRRSTDLEQELAPFYTPYFYLALALLTAILLFKVSRSTLAQAAVATYQRVRLASIVLIFIIAITQLLLKSEVNQADLPSMPQVLGSGFASIMGGLVRRNVAAARKHSAILPLACHLSSPRRRGVFLHPFRGVHLGQERLFERNCEGPVHA